MDQKLERTQTNTLFGVSAKRITMLLNGLEIDFGAGFEMTRGLTGNEKFEKTGELPRIECEQWRRSKKREEGSKCRGREKWL